MSAATHEGFTFSITLTIEDYVRFFNLVGRRQQRFGGGGAVYLVALFSAAPVAAALGVWGAGSAPRHDAWMIGLLCGLGFLFGMIALLVAGRIAQMGFTRRLSAAALRYGATLVVSVNPQGVEVTSDQLVFRWHWAGIEAVTVEDGDLVFWTGGVGAVRVPERTFANAAERDAVLAYARAQLQSATR